MAINFINMHENLEDYRKLVGLPQSNPITANLYTDGSYSVELNQAGYGAFLQHGGKFYCWGGELTTGLIASRFEHLALFEGLKLAKSLGVANVNIYIDCKCLYDELIQGKTEWANAILPMLDRCNIFLIYSHVGVYGNEFADELSRLYLGGLPASGFYMEANDYRIFNVKRVATNYEEILGRIKKTKKLCSLNSHSTAQVSLKPEIVLLENKNTRSTVIKATINRDDTSPQVELIHPFTGEPYMVCRLLYNKIKTKREIEIKAKGLKKKTVKDSYIAQEVHRIECLKARKQKRNAA